MLSRPARAMFDLGRHVERADASARLLDAHLALLDAASLDAAVPGESGLPGALVSLVAGARAPAGPVGSDGLLRALAYDPASPVSVLGAWAAARADARAAREVLPEQVLEVLAATRAAMPTGRWRASDSTAFFAWVRERTAVVVGALEATAPRDEGWHFLLLGRQLERAAATARLVASTALHGPAASADPAAGTGSHRSGRRAASLPPVWHEVLRAAGAPTVMVSAATTAAAAAHLVVVERRWPRSVVAALVAAEDALEALASHGVTAEALDGPRRRVAAVRTELEYRPVAEVLADLGGTAARVERAAAAAAAGVEHAALAADEPTRWLVHAG